MSSLALIILSFFVSVLPTAGAVFLVWLSHRRRDEISWATGASYLWGAFVAAPVAFAVAKVMLGSITGIVSPEIKRSLLALLIAPWLEEGLKFAGITGLAFYFLWKQRFTRYQGFLLGLAAGMGFALSENFLACMEQLDSIDWAEWKSTAFYRVASTTPMHGLAGALMGIATAMCVGLQGRPWRRVAFLGGGLVAAVAVHGFWNIVAMNAAHLNWPDIPWILGGVMWLTLALLWGFFLLGNYFGSAAYDESY